MTDVLFDSIRLLVTHHLNINEGDNFGLETVLGCLDNDNELLAHLWPNFESNLFLKLLCDRVFDEPAIEFGFRVLNECAILIVEWQFVSVVLAEYGIAIELGQTRDAHIDDLILVTGVCQKECRAQNFSANKLTIINDVGVNIKDLIDVSHVLLLLAFSFHFVLMVVVGGEKRFRQAINFLGVFLIVAILCQLSTSKCFAGAFLISSLDVLLILLVLLLF